MGVAVGRGRKLQCGAPPDVGDEAAAMRRPGWRAAGGPAWRDVLAAWKLGGSLLRAH